MNTDSIEKYYFLGIGGIGMSALALYFNDRQKTIKGYDRTQTSITDNLMQNGIDITFNDSVDSIPDEFLNPDEQTLIVYTPAIPTDHPQLIYFQKKNFNILKRSQLLGFITANHFTIAVAGTHGKTSSSWMITHILRTSGIDCVALLGGISVNYNTNYLPSQTTDCDIFVVEADEYDKSFLQLHPDIAIVTSLEPDHLDIYGNQNEVKKAYQAFIDNLKHGGIVVTTDKVKLKIPAKASNHFIVGENENNNPRLKQTNVESASFNFSFVLNGKEINNVVSGVPGIHNINNALTAIAAVNAIRPLAENTIYNSILTFSGVKRRFEYIIKTDKIVFIDDYAHHPTEINATISTAKMLYPGQNITVVFQPHLFSRTRDFAREFAISLAEADCIVLLDIYPARELPIEGITSQMLLEMIDSKNKMLISYDYLSEWTENFEEGVLITMGAGDIDKLVEPIKRVLLKKI